ncbi:hypothetical protein [Arthrobacter methylotrophus]|uniref:hypothetical protein n=1 Tax=Arthrobacter methylotrophus TaxID=121291 RepID=UPI0031ED71FC
MAPNSSLARAPVETQNATSARSRCEPNCANSSSNRSSGMLRGARHELRPLPATGFAAERLHRTAMRSRTAGTGMRCQRERVEHRPGPGFQMEIIEAAQHALAMRPRRRLVPIATRWLAGHRVHSGHRRVSARSRGTTSRIAPMRPRGLGRDLQPPDRIACLNPCRLIPTTPSAHKKRNQRNRSIPYDRRRCSAPPPSFTNSLNRVCLEDRPEATISFTSHDAQPKTGTTPAPPKATVNDDHPTSTGGT